MLPLSLSLADSSSQAINPIAGLLSGGFAVSNSHQFGGAGNMLSPTVSPTASLSAGPSPMAPAVPFADGLLGFGQNQNMGSTTSSLLMPAALLVGALIVAFAIFRK